MVSINDILEVTKFDKTHWNLNFLLFRACIDFLFFFDTKLTYLLFHQEGAIVITPIDPTTNSNYFSQYGFSSQFMNLNNELPQFNCIFICYVKDVFSLP